MKLLIDIGNTCLKWASVQQGQLGSQQRLTHHGRDLRQSLVEHWQTLPVPEQGVFISSVAHPLYVEQIRDFCQKQWQCEPFLIHSTAQFGPIRSAYFQPERLGVDRWLALIGAWFVLGGRNCCVVDCGTAITLDVLTSDGQHQGGLILPGISKMHHILAQDTHSLAQYHTDPPPLSSESPLLANHSQHAIQLGIYYAVIGLIEHVTAAYRADPLQLILTGGAATLLLPAMPTDCHYWPDLVLQGLLKASELQ